MPTRVLAFLVAACFFMENLDATIVTTALPTMARDLGIPTTDAGLIVTSYLVALAVFVPLGGWLLTRVSGRRLLTVAIGIFTAASLACALSTTLTPLILARVLQGIGGALMVPIGRQLVLRDAPVAEIQRLIAYIVWPALVAPVVAPLIGGVIVTRWTWHWIFIINVPIGLVAMALALVIVPPTVEGTPTRLDVPGFLLTGEGLGCVIWATHLLSGTADPAALAWGVLGVALCAAAVVHLRRSDHPLMDLRVFRDRVFACSQTGLLGFTMVVSAVPFLLPLLLQTSFGWSPVAAGAMVTFIFAGNIAVKPFTSPMLNLLGYRLVIWLAVLGLGATAITLMAVPPGTAPWIVALVAFLSGVFRSSGFTAIQTLAFATIDNTQRAAANVVASVNQQVATALGVALAVIGMAAGAALSGATSAQTTFVIASVVATLPAVLGVLAVVALPRGAGNELRTRAH